MSNVFSFDVFDTCLTRKFAAPSDLFLELAHRILRRLPELAAKVDAETLWACRIEAERSARRGCLREEVTLAEIWDEFARRAGSAELASLSSLELELEDESLLPIPSTLHEIDELRAAGSRILFISDIYLPRSFVVAQLLKGGFARAGDGFYISSKSGKTKGTGNLFKEVLTAEKLESHQLFHCGDNVASDIKAPGILGIHGRLVSYRQVPRAEAALLAAEGMDYNVRSKLVGAMRAERLRADFAGLPKSVPTVCEFLNPLVFAFASWILGQARHDGIRRLYFLARDCQVTYLAAKELSPHFGDIECRYLHVSRQSLFLPSSTAISEAGMPWLRRAYETPSLERLLAKLELSYADVQSVWAARAGSRRGKYTLAHEDDWRFFWESLNREPLRSTLNARIQERRQAAQSYLSAEGLLEHSASAVVDLGWYLSCQSALRGLLRGVDPAAECRGYYLGLRRERLAPADTGKATALFHQRGADLPAGVCKQFLFQHATLLEHVLGLADHPSVHHYQDANHGARPVFQKADGASADPKLAQAIHAEVRDFAARHAGLATEISRTGVPATIIAGIAGAFAQHPSHEFARALAAVQASGDQNNLCPSPLAVPLGVLEMAQVWIPRRLRIMFGGADSSSLWMEGRLAASSPVLRQLYALRKSVGNRFHPHHA